jgi:hypothetical protein
MNKVILLSFDVEEFDVPEEYGQTLNDSVKFSISRLGLLNIIELLERLNIRVTFFVTANFALHHQKLIKALSQHHEIASHGFYHSQFALEDLSLSKQTLEKITGSPIYGFRMARLKPIKDIEIQRAGYRYNSSMNPTYLPGRYNNFLKPRTFYYRDRLLNLPVSVTPLIRFPLFWLSWKNFPLFLIKFASSVTIKHDSYLNLYFHPWEFTDISQFTLPYYIKKDCGVKMLHKLETYLTWLKTQGDFITISQFQRGLDKA